jgi:hypothetical protein
MAESDAEQFFAATHAQKRKATSRPEMESQATSQKKSHSGKAESFLDSFSN